MGRFLLPLLVIALDVYWLVHEDAINDEELASMEPQDPARQAALPRCFEEDRIFNRFRAAARAACYQKFLRPDPTADRRGAAGQPGARTKLPTNCTAPAAIGMNDTIATTDRSSAPSMTHAATPTAATIASLMTKRARNPSRMRHPGRGTGRAAGRVTIRGPSLRGCDAGTVSETGCIGIGNGGGAGWNARWLAASRPACSGGISRSTISSGIAEGWAAGTSKRPVHKGCPSGVSTSWALIRSPLPRARRLPLTA